MAVDSIEEHGDREDSKNAQAPQEEKAKAEDLSDDPLQKISPTVEAGDKNRPEAGG